MSVQINDCIDLIIQESAETHAQTLKPILAHDYKMLDEAMQNAKAGFWCLNLNTQELKMSDSFRARLTREESNRLDTTGFFSIVHKDDVDRVKTKWEKDIITGYIDLKYRLVLEGEGEIWQRSHGCVQCDENGIPENVFVLMTDATGEFEKESHLILAEQSSKAKSEFLARMSHEIRTPLNAIIGMADAIKDEPLSPDALETVQYIDEAAQGLHQLLTQTLDHAKLISAKAEAEWELADPKKVLADSMRLWRPQCLKKGLKLNILQGRDIPKSVLIDRFKLGQCLNNLLSNAIKFTRNGSITVILKRAEYRNQDSLIIAVKDTGIGMSSEAKSKVFDEFTQADTSIKREYGGTGLGMNITQRLVQIMEGHISVSSQKGEGSTFVIALPLKTNVTDRSVKQKTEPVEIKSVERSPGVSAKINHIKPDIHPKHPPFSNMSVLCVEDNPVNQRVIEKLIGKRVEALHFADNGQEALEKLTTLQVDIVLMDIHMPVMDGIEATLEIRKSKMPWANVIIIALTADPDYQQARICRNLGMNGTISKPVTRQDIAQAFESAISNIASNFGEPAYLPVKVPA